MFSNSTEGEMFTDKWCGCCARSYHGSFCDAAAMILWGDPPPPFLVRVEPTAEDPTGVICRAFEYGPS